MQKFFCLLILSLYSSSYAMILGSVSVFDSGFGSRSITYEVKGEYAITEGDIIIGRANTFSKKNASIITKLGGKTWPNSIMPFEIAKDLPFKNKAAIYEAIDHIQSKTNIKFIKLNNENRKIYLDYISFVPTSGTTCSSYVGKQRGSQVIELAPRCNTMNIVHEIGHALGLWHEQSRMDRDFYIRILWENIKEDHKFNFEQHLNSSEDFGEYDYSSIMHYPATAFSKNGLKTIETLQQNVEIGQRRGLSDKDIAALNAMYPG